MCLNEYRLDPAQFLSALGLALQPCFKKPKVELELLTDIDMLLMVETDIDMLLIVDEWSLPSNTQVC